MIECKAEKSDYVKDGILYCGVCGRNKERYVNLFGVNKKVSCLCLCGEIKRKQDEEKYRREDEEQRLSVRRSESMMDNAYYKAKFDGFERDNVNGGIFDLCVNYSCRFDDFSRKNSGMLFYGDVGTGKTFAAACIANDLIEKGYSVLMTSFTSILSAIQGDHEAEEDIMRKVRNYSLVIFDDLGAERNTDYAQEKVFNIIDTRYRVGKPMILTTNLGIMQITGETDLRYKRTYDRILDVCYPVHFTGKTRRRKVNNERFGEIKKFL